MKRITTILFFVFVACNISIATICITSFEQDSAKADIIFVGKHLETYVQGIVIDGIFEQISIFEIDESFKGLESSQKYISVLGGYFCCDLNFEKDSSYLVFAFKLFENSDFYWTNDCSLTKKISTQQAQDYYKRLGWSKSHDWKNYHFEKFKDNNAILDSVINHISILEAENYKIRNLNNKLFKLLGVLATLLCLFLIVRLYKRKVTSS